MISQVGKVHPLSNNTNQLLRIIQQGCHRSLSVVTGCYNSGLFSIVSKWECWCFQWLGLGTGQGGLFHPCGGRRVRERAVRREAGDQEQTPAFCNQIIIWTLLSGMFPCLSGELLSPKQQHNARLLLQRSGSTWSRQWGHSLFASLNNCLLGQCVQT